MRFQQFKLVKSRAKTLAREKVGGRWWDLSLSLFLSLFLSVGDDVPVLDDNWRLHTERGRSGQRN